MDEPIPTREYLRALAVIASAIVAIGVALTWLVVPLVACGCTQGPR